MDKETADRMTDQDLQIIKAKLEVDKNCDCPDCRDKREMVREIERLWEALTHPPVVEAKPQGEAALEYAQSIVKSLLTKHWPEIAGFKVLDDMQGVLSQLDNMTCGLIRKEAARVPPEPPACPYCNMKALREAIEAQGKE